MTHPVIYRTCYRSVFALCDPFEFICALGVELLRDGVLFFFFFSSLFFPPTLPENDQPGPSWYFLAASKAFL